MSENRDSTHPTLTLSTKLEEEFVSPLTAVRGALEILRDFPDLTSMERKRFVATALQECARLEKGVEHLASSVYAAGQRAQLQNPVEPPRENYHAYASRIHMLDEYQTIEVDFSDFEFSSSKIVNEFYNILDQLIEDSKQRWYFLVNYRNCSIWPEAWVAFAHRGKKVNTSYSLGTVHYDSEASDSESDKHTSTDLSTPNMFKSRAQALAQIDAMRLASG